MTGSDRQQTQWKTQEAPTDLGSDLVTGSDRQLYSACIFCTASARERSRDGKRSSAMQQDECRGAPMSLGSDLVTGSDRQGGSRHGGGFGGSSGAIS